MKKRQKRAIRQFMKRLILIDAGIFGLTGIVCWLGGWRTWEAYSNGLLVACAVVLGIAIASAYGGWMNTSSFRYQFSSTASQSDSLQRAQAAIRDRDEGLRLMLYAAIICALPLSAAVLIQQGLFTG
ncbi:MAG: hypothetical protein JXN59_12730 [Anaerolineae bacterium]|nr:hypothetical protein [Anaerolineae bacterium]